ncbi:MAG: dipeptide epimerase [Alphaproteobacteria bacterium]|nr:dipeptide epimerase [Alphaproteobacteria bacterium]|tara:strand:- start:21880 stop:22875 length:996 start_codon:yes stop_codon:yes gene_type:complete
MLRDLRTRIESFPLATPFRISRGVRTVAEVVEVAVEAGGVIGRGEAVPYARYGETLDSVTQQIAAIRGAFREGLTRVGLQELLPAGAARNAVDCALWDLESKAGGPATALSVLKPVATALTIGIDTPEAMGREAAKLANVPVVKVKVDAGEVEACLRAVRQAAPNPELIVDPNESWDLGLLQSVQPLLEELRVAFVEQPLPSSEDVRLAELVRRVPVCADESCHTSDDLDRLSGLYDIVNIKLDKTGGLTEAFNLLEAAREKKFGVMVGCMISSSLSIVPALQIAMQADYVDLDGPVWLKNDRTGGVSVKDGWLMPPEPGFWGTAEAMPSL